MANFQIRFLSSLIPPNYVLSVYYGRPRTSRGCGEAIITNKSVHLIYVSKSVFSTIECVGCHNFIKIFV